MNGNSLFREIIEHRFMVYALLLTLLFLVVHAAGFRQYTGILSGTHAIDRMSQYFGILYIVSYFCLVVVSPIFLIANWLLFGLGLIVDRISIGKRR